MQRAALSGVGFAMQLYTTHRVSLTFHFFASSQLLYHDNEASRSASIQHSPPFRCFWRLLDSNKQFLTSLWSINLSEGQRPVVAVPA